MKEDVIVIHNEQELWIYLSHPFHATYDKRKLRFSKEFLKRSAWKPIVKEK